MGGSEMMVTELAVEMAAIGHEVTVRLPYADAVTDYWRGVQWISKTALPQHSDINFAFDQYEEYDPSGCRILVACRSDPPRHDHFDEEIFLSDTHRRHCGRPDRPFIGGGVRLADYAKPSKRGNHILYTSSPDRGIVHAEKIARGRNFIATYKPVAMYPGFPKSEMKTREELVVLQRTAQCAIFPIDPIRPSEFFCMAILECLAARTPVLASDADCLPELWGDVVPILPRPIDYAEWASRLDGPFDTEPGYQRAQQYDWPLVALRYLHVANFSPTKTRGSA